MISPDAPTPQAMDIDKVTFPNLYGQYFSVYINHTDKTVILCLDDNKTFTIEHSNTHAYLEAVLNAEGTELC